MTSTDRAVWQLPNLHRNYDMHIVLRVVLNGCAWCKWRNFLAQKCAPIFGARGIWNPCANFWRNRCIFREMTQFVNHQFCYSIFGEMTRFVDRCYCYSLCCFNYSIFCPRPPKLLVDCAWRCTTMTSFPYSSPGFASFATLAIQAPSHLSLLCDDDPEDQDGASYSDICLFCGISVPAFYYILWETIRAINKAIKICFPSSPEECAILASSFEAISYGNVITNCVGVLDGYLLPIVTPRKSHAKNVRSYFSGHYQKYGINIQACSDAHNRFTFLGIGGPGVTKDRVAIKESGLHELVERLPPGYICIGDCAYQPTEKLVPIFGGDLALQKDNDNFNFFASQLRIRIEMAFGLMTRKWGILQRPLSNSLRSIKHIICCIARLHNFCIDERLKSHANSSALNTRTALSFTQLAYMHAAAQVRISLMTKSSIFPLSHYYYLLHYHRLKTRR